VIAAKTSLRRATVGAAIVVATVVGLTGCLASTALTVKTPTPVPTVTVTATPTSTPTVMVTVTATPDPTVPPVAAAPAPVEVIPEDEPVVITTPSDNGVRAHATGAVEIDAQGIPYRYTVASGDIAVEICSRFNRYIWQLADANAVMLKNPFLIHAGDTILLTATEMPAGYVVPTQ
jgi:hypothetical protein